MQLFFIIITTSACTTNNEQHQNVVVSAKELLVGAMSLLVSSRPIHGDYEHEDDNTDRAPVKAMNNALLKLKLEDDEDWKMPLAFNKPRHHVTIEGINYISQTWRMKERVMSH